MVEVASELEIGQAVVAAVHYSGVVYVHPERRSSWHIDPATPTFPVYRRRSE